MGIEKLKMRNKKHKIIERIICEIKNNKSFLIVAHDNLDGDALGAGLALGLALTKLNKNAKFLISSQVPEKYRFLPGIKELAVNSANFIDYDILFSVDTACWEQLSTLKPVFFKKHTIINIDHHVDNALFGKINWVCKDASAAGEQIFELIDTLGIIDPDIATCLYTSIITDTGSFQYSNTTQETHRIVASLIGKGASPVYISRHIYENIPLARLRLIMCAFSTLKTTHNNQIVWLWITNAMYKKSGAKKEDTEGLIDYLKAIAGVKVAIVFKETLKKNEFRVTFRSKDENILVNNIAHHFNGGGHRAAAGCNVNGTKKETEKKVLRATLEEFNKK
jgi:phosphoesterase RecJ-like protein